MTISFFDLLAPVIKANAEFAANQQGVSVDEIYNQILAEAEHNSAEWYSNRVPNLNYDCQECRLAYLYIVAAANAATFKHVLDSDDDLRNHILETARERCQVRLCAFGAGPGTELMAVAKFFEEQQLKGIAVDFQLLDKVQEWADSWYGIRDEVNNTFLCHYGTRRSSWPMIPSGNFLTCDVTQYERLGRLGQVWNQDIYVVNFLLSEIFNDDPGLKTFVKAVAEYAPPKALFVFIDRRGYVWETRVSAIAKDAGLVLAPFRESQQQGLDGEEPRHLGKIYDMLGATKSPRNGWNVVYSIGRKT